MSQEKLPPHSIEAERGILGCVLLEPGRTLDTLDSQRFNPEYFYDLRHRTVFEAMLKLRARGNPVEMIPLQTVLRDVGTLEDVGGLPFLLDLADATPEVETTKLSPTFVPTCNPS